MIVSPFGSMIYKENCDGFGNYKEGKKDKYDAFSPDYDFRVMISGLCFGIEIEGAMLSSA